MQKSGWPGGFLKTERIMCKKCGYTVIDGTPVHINGDLSKMDAETMDALKSLVKIARNYDTMKKIQNKSKKPGVL